MPEHIVIVLRSAQSPDEARLQLVGVLPSWAVLEPQFHDLPPPKIGEPPVITEMRRMMRFACPPSVDIEALVRSLQADPQVEYVYREPPAEPAKTSAP